MRKTMKTALLGAGCAAVLLLTIGGCRVETGDPDSLRFGGPDYGIPDSKERFAIQRNAHRREAPDGAPARDAQPRD